MLVHDAKEKGKAVVANFGKSGRANVAAATKNRIHSMG